MVIRALRTLLPTMAILASAITGPVAVQAADEAAAAPYVRTAEAGAGLSRYTGNLGRGNGQFLRVGLVKENDHRWLFETGRDERFGESSLGFGASYGRHLARATAVTVGLASGTGEFLAPRYRFDFRVEQGVLKDRNLVLSAGYIRVQSKQENSSDGLAVGAVLWLPHWVLEGNALYDIGHPGDAVSKSWGLGATWYLYKKTYLGAGLNGGQVSYMLVGPGTQSALVDYEADGWNLHVQQWFTATAGLNLRYDHGTTSYYQVDGYTVSIFREF